MFRLLRAAAALCSLAVLVGGTLAGCTTAADAGSSFGDSELINDVAGRLAGASDNSYTATYALTDNSHVSVAHTHDPDSTTFQYRDTTVLITPNSTTSCTTLAKSTCTVTPGDTGEAALAPAIDRLIEAGGMIRPETVVAILTRMSLNADAILSENDQAVAGTSETCVSITGVPAADRFTACVTTDGLLGAFSGTVDGVAIDIQLVQFALSPGPSAS